MRVKWHSLIAIAAATISCSSGPTCKVLGEVENQTGECACASGTPAMNGFCPCFEDSQCGAGHCEQNFCFAFNQAIGAPCASAMDCNTLECRNGFCAGGLCHSNSDCFSGDCDLNVNRCNHGPDGADCSEDQNCIGGVCVMETQTCGALPKGGTCGRDIDCQSKDCFKMIPGFPQGVCM